MDTNILLESGTNELEILEFVVDGHNYGINVAKIREIISYTELTPIPNAHPLWREHLVRAERQLLLSIWRSVWE